MIVKAKKYGNSHVITIPPALWNFFKFTDETEFSFENHDGKFVIETKSKTTESIQKVDQKYGSVFKNLAKK